MSTEDADRSSGASAAMGRPRLVVLAVLLAIGAVWFTQLRGLVSSNDGSNLALARALALRGRPEIDDEQMLTLLVDRARRGKHVYSDRPPGTAFAALPAVSMTPSLDEALQERSLARLRSGDVDVREAIVVQPATNAYLETYGARRLRTDGPSLNLLALQGTAIVVGAHCVLVGLVGIAIGLALLKRDGVDPVSKVVVALVLGLGTSWGPYSTALFSHVTAGVALAGHVYGLERLRDAQEWRSRWLWGALAGLAGAWAVSADYALALAVIPLTLLLASPLTWPTIALGVVPVAAATLAYHDAAFGSPFSIGYDFQSNFDFARERSATFSGNPMVGLWHLWGAGVTLQSPIVWVGVYGLAVGPHRRWLYGLLPWMALLVFHQTPWGGATSDYRYLVPALPLLAVGVAQVWSRHVTQSSRRWVGLAIMVLGSISAILTWVSFWAWRG